MNPLLSSWVKRVHRSSGVAVYASIVLLVEALGEAVRGFTALHAVLMSAVVLPVFIAGIASSYALSSIRRSGRAETLSRLLVIATIVVVLAGIVSGSIVLFNRLPPRQLLGLVYGFYAAVLWAAALSSPRGSVALSVAGLAYAFTMASIYLLAQGLSTGFYEYYLGLVYAVAVTSIYAVTIHSFPSTYGDKPRNQLVYILYIVQAVGLAAYAWRPGIGVLVFTLAMILYPLAARLDRILVYIEKARSMKPGPARSSHLYFLIGHIFVLAYIVLVLASSLMYSGSPDIYKLLYIYIHTTTLGFVTQHILIHAPMMVPIIIGIPTARRYNVLNYVALFLATISFPISEEAALILLVISLLATILIVWPRQLRTPHSL